MRAAPPNMTRLQCPPLAAATAAATAPVVAKHDCRTAPLRRKACACQVIMGPAVHDDKALQCTCSNC
jgi:hypothetical protein